MDFRDRGVGNDEPAFEPRVNLHQLVDDGIDVPVVKVLVTRRYRPKHLCCEGAKILPQSGV